MLKRKFLLLTSAFLLLTSFACSDIQFVKPVVTCEYGGETYQVGAGNITAEDGCNTCFCDQGGVVACTEMACEDKDDVDDPNVKMVNPAALKCKVDGYKYEIREDSEGNQNGYCIDEQGTECVAWEYFREECLLGEEIKEYEAKLKDVTGGEASGIALARFSAEKFTHEVMAKNLPTLEEGYFYEGWLIKTLPVLDVISTGEMVVGEEDGEFKLSFESPDDLSQYTGVVITLEPDDSDPDPAEHILEGKLQLIVEE